MTYSIILYKKEFQEYKNIDNFLLRNNETNQLKLLWKTYRQNIYTHILQNKHLLLNFHVINFFFQKESQIFQLYYFKIYAANLQVSRNKVRGHNSHERYEAEADCGSRVTIVGGTDIANADVSFVVVAAVGDFAIGRFVGDDAFPDDHFVFGGLVWK